MPALPKRIETPRLLLEKPRYEDAEEIFYGYASKELATRFVSWPTHNRIEETRDYVTHARRAWLAGTEFAYVIRLKNAYRLVGGFGLINEQGRMQFGYIVNPSQWGKGFATETCVHMMQLLRSLQGIYRIWTLVDADNIGSIKVLTRSGLVEEVRLEKWMRFVNQDNRPKDCLLFKLPL